VRIRGRVVLRRIPAVLRSFNFLCNPSRSSPGDALLVVRGSASAAPVGPEIDVETIDAEDAGRAAHLRFGRSEDDERWVHGIIRRMEARGASAERGGEKRHAYRVWLAPALWLLGRTKDSRIFQDESVPEIVRAVLREGGVRTRFRLFWTYPPRSYCVQYQESDLDFVERILAEEGILHFFDQPSSEAEAEILVLTDDSGLCQPIAGSAQVNQGRSAASTSRAAARPRPHGRPRAVALARGTRRRGRREPPASRAARSAVSAGAGTRAACGTGRPASSRRYATSAS
jgi:hypothetical protein